MDYLSTLEFELVHAKQRLTYSDDESRWLVEQQIRQIGRDIKCVNSSNSMKNEAF